MITAVRCGKSWVGAWCAAIVAAAAFELAGAEEKAAETAVPRRKEPARLQLTGGESALELGKPEAAPAPPDPASPPRPIAPSGAKPVSPAKAASGEPVSLRYKFAVNQQTYYTVNHTMKITTQKDQTSETARNESDTVRHFRVVSVGADGNAILELMIDRVRMSAQFGEADPITYDSASRKKDSPDGSKGPGKDDRDVGFDSASADSVPPQFQNIRNVIGKPTARISVSPRGELLNVVRVNAPAPSPPGADIPDNDPSNNFLVVLPEKPVKPGDTWSDKFDVRVTIAKGLTKTVTILRRYELVAVEGGQARIATEATVITPIRDPQVNGQLIQRTPSGSIVFDVEKGQIVSRELSLDKTEVGVFGDNSSMRAVSTRIEKLSTRDAALQTAAEAGPVRK